MVRRIPYPHLAEYREPKMKKMGPLAPAHPLVLEDEPCRACGKVFATGAFVTLVSLGPGDDKEEREKARTGRPYNAVAVPVHWSCATGEDA